MVIFACFQSEEIILLTQPENIICQTSKWFIGGKTHAGLILPQEPCPPLYRCPLLMKQKLWNSRLPPAVHRDLMWCKTELKQGSVPVHGLIHPSCICKYTQVTTGASIYTLPAFPYREHLTAENTTVTAFILLLIQTTESF